MIEGREGTRKENKMNASPTTNPTALVNAAIDLGLEICECPFDFGFIIVTGAHDAVVEWVNETPFAHIMPNGAGRSIAHRMVRL